MTATQTIPTAPPTDSGAVEPIDLYREVHKGLRLALFELTQTAGALDPADPASVDGFCRLFADIDMMLQTHHSHEDGAVLGALITAYVPAAVVDGIERDHDHSEQRLAELRALVAELRSGADNDRAIYDAVTTFVAGYLVHMELEETRVMPALRDMASVEDLHSITMEIRTSVPPPDMCVFLRYMLPAMNPDERTAILGGMKMGAPPEIFEMFWGVAEASLSPSDVTTIANRIAA